MWVEGDFIVPSAVVAVVPTGVKEKRGAVTSTGCEVWLKSGGIRFYRLPATQVVSMLGMI